LKIVGLANRWERLRRGEVESGGRYTKGLGDEQSWALATFFRAELGTCYFF